METKLRQLNNIVVIVGVVKEIKLDEKISKNGNAYIGGHIIVETNIEGKLGEHRVKVQTMATAKTYGGIQTIAREAKVGDKLRISASIELNEYVDKEEFKSFNGIKAFKINRVEQNVQDVAELTADVVISSIRERENEEGTPIGLAFNGFTVGYGSDVIELKDMVVGVELTDTFVRLFVEGCTAPLVFDINNYVEVSNTAQKTEATFGRSSSAGNTAGKRVRNLEVVGGDPAFEEPKSYSEEEIELAQRALKLKRDSITSTPATPRAFSKPVATPAPKDVNVTEIEDEDDLPF